MSNLAWQVKVLRELLSEAEKRMNEQEGHESEPVQLNGPCIAERRDGAIVLVFRYSRGSGDTHCYGIDGDCIAVNDGGRFDVHGTQERDIVKTIRSLTEKEIVDFQLKGIIPSISP